MAEIKPDEISAILRQQLGNFTAGAELEEVGTVLQVGDGIARVYGLNNVRSGELVEFENGVKAIALNLEEDNVGVVLMGDSGANETFTVVWIGVRRFCEMLAANATAIAIFANQPWIGGQSSFDTPSDFLLAGNLDFERDWCRPDDRLVDFGNTSRIVKRRHPQFPRHRVNDASYDLECHKIFTVLRSARSQRNRQGDQRSVRLSPHVAEFDIVGPNSKRSIAAA